MSTLVNFFRPEVVSARRTLISSNRQQLHPICSLLSLQVGLKHLARKFIPTNPRFDVTSGYVEADSVAAAAAAAPAAGAGAGGGGGGELQD